MLSLIMSRRADHGYTYWLPVKAKVKNISNTLYKNNRVSDHVLAYTWVVHLNMACAAWWGQMYQLRFISQYARRSLQQQ